MTEKLFEVISATLWKVICDCSRALAPSTPRGLADKLPVSERRRREGGGESHLGNSLKQASILKGLGLGSPRGRKEKTLALMERGEKCLT